MKKLPTQKRRAVRRGVWILVLLALLILCQYAFLPRQSLKRVETTMAVSPTHILDTVRVGGQVRYLSVNDKVLLYTSHKFFPLWGWWSDSIYPILKEGPVTAYAICEAETRSQVFGVTTLPEAATVRIYSKELDDPDLAIREAPILHADDGASYFWMRWEEDNGIYSKLFLLDDHGGLLTQYDLTWGFIQHD